MTHAFLPMPDRERAAFAQHYLAYLRRRDGLPDLGERTLSRREEAHSRARRGTVGPRAVRIDPSAFSRNLGRREPEPGLDRATIWALAVAKGNRAERMGVEHKLARQGFEPAGVDDPLTYVELQEVYHTRLLLHVLSLAGLDCEVGPPASAITRAGVKLIGELPRSMLEVLALAFEAVGVVAFRALRDEAREIFADEPELGARIDACFAELLVDEVGHVHFLRSRMGPLRLGASRALLPFAKRALFDDNREMKRILTRRGALDRIAYFDPDEAVRGDADRLPDIALRAGEDGA